MKEFIISLILLLTACGCLGKEASYVVEPSYLNSHKDYFDHKKVSVKGRLFYENENTALWDVGGGYPGGDPSHCITVLSSKKNVADLSRLNHKVVIITGIFYRNFMSANRVFLGACNVTGVDVISVVSSGSALPN